MSHSTLIPGFEYFPSLLSEAEHDELFATLATLPYRKVVMHGVVAKRRVVCFGFDYVYRSRSVVAAEPVPSFLTALKRRCAEAAGVEDRFNQVIVADYPSRAGIGWHTDAPAFGDVILGVSLGAPAHFHLRPRTGGRAVGRIVVAPGSLYMLRGSARWEHHHRVAPVPARRISLTFREVPL